MNVPAADLAPERTADIALTVVLTMREMGVLGLPRNYELFYEALSGSNPELSRELAALGKSPKQEALDQLGRKFFTASHARSIVEGASETVARDIDEILHILMAERSHLEKYERILGETAEGLSGRHLLGTDILRRIARVMAGATVSTIDRGRQTVSSLGDKSSELEQVKSKLEEYKRLADTDPLTHIWNRRAFDQRIARIYDDSRHVLFDALLLMDIDRFKEINDRHGHPVGDRILQIVAGVLQSHCRQDMFVARTGGEEFAMIVEGKSAEAIFTLADNLRREIADTPFTDVQTGRSYGPVTISTGICMASDASGPEDLYAKADRALYRSKVGGRNRVTLHGPGKSIQKDWMLYRSE